MIDAVVTYHENPLTCGVARFNAELARRLGVPLVPLAALPHCRYSHPLVSLKWSELPADVRATLPHRLIPLGSRFLWHDCGHDGMSRWWPSMWAAQIGIPALVRPQARTNGRPRWFSMGMAHKLTYSLYQRASTLQRPGSIWVSAWLHEGTTWDGMNDVLDTLGRLAPVTFLGSLTDAALAWVWPEVDVFVAFLPDGLQANHTSVHAALDAGVPVITNWGEATPADMKARTVNIHDITAWPESWPTGPSPYTWERLMEALRA
jgi:hypothetical protein